MLGKGPTLGADMVFIDLEDSVSPLEKESARGKAVTAIRDHLLAAVQGWLHQQDDDIALLVARYLGH